MKGSKEEDTRMGPLFPRLHVNDADKGGPRAPPRNKMALYEQFSIPSQRFNSASSMLPLSPSKASNLVPLNPASQGCGRERNMVSLVHLPSYVPPHVSDRADAKSSGGVHHGRTREFERSNASHRSLAGTRSAAESSIQLVGESNARDSCMKINDADDFAVPTFDQSGNALVSKIDASFAAPKKLASSNHKNLQKDILSSENKLPNSTKIPLEQMRTSDNKSRSFERKLNERQLKEFLMSEKSVNLPVHDRVAEKSSMEKTSGDRDGTNNVHCNQIAMCTGPVLCQESGRNVDQSRAKVLNDVTYAETGSPSTARHDSSHKEKSVKGHKTSKFSGISNREDGADDNWSLDANRKYEVSDASIVDCVSGLELSPDDVVGVIGPKHFWKARRAIINQQRVFAIQVFELHRILKVQKLIASSPHLLLEGSAFLLKASTKAPNKVLLAEHKTIAQSLSVREKDAPQKPNQNTESATESIVGRSSLPTCEDGINGLRSQEPSVGPCSATPSQVPTVPENSKNNPWYFRPPANQWLLPVMSPSEGLVYKPYTGPCPPTGSFMAPIYGNCTPLGLAPVAGDSIHPAFGVSATHQPPNMGIMSGPPTIAANYFPSPYGLPAMNPMMTSSVVEQVSNLVASRPTGPMDQNSRSSCNMSNPRKAFSGRHLRLPTSKDSEFQGSTASSPSEMAQLGGVNASPLFPTAPAANNFSQPFMSTGRDSQIQVIKVVPHNARSASESAARIFRSIQEERQQQE